MKRGAGLMMGEILGIGCEGDGGLGKEGEN